MDKYIVLITQNYHHLNQTIGNIKAVQAMRNILLCTFNDGVEMEN